MERASGRGPYLEVGCRVFFTEFSRLSSQLKSMKLDRSIKVAPKKRFGMNQAVRYR